MTEIEEKDYYNNISNYIDKITIVLDVDSTLLHTTLYPITNKNSDGEFLAKGIIYYVYLRPGMQEFLRDIFATYKHIGLWSFGSKEYINAVLEFINLPRPFDFIFAADTPPGELFYKNCKTLTSIDDYFDRISFIVEDKFENCVFNVDRAIIVPPFYANIENDYDFTDTSFYLEKKILNWFSKIYNHKGFHCYDKIDV